MNSGIQAEDGAMNGGHPCIEDSNIDQCLLYIRDSPHKNTTLMWTLGQVP